MVFSKKTESNDAAPIERLDQHPHWREAWQQLQALQTRRNDVRRELDEALADLRHATPRDANLDREAAAMLGDALSAVATRTDVNARVAELRREQVVVDRAIDLQRKRLAEVEAAARREIAAAVRPEYARILSALKIAVTNLAAAVEAEHTFRHRTIDLFGCGVLTPMPVRRIGDAGGNAADASEGLTTWLAELEHEYPEVK